MKAIYQDNRSGRLIVEEVAPPALRPGGLLIRTAFSLISAGTERTSRELAKKGLIGKALARPDQARKVQEYATGEASKSKSQQQARQKAREHTYEPPAWTPSLDRDPSRGHDRGMSMGR